MNEMISSFLASSGYRQMWQKVFSFTMYRALIVSLRVRKFEKGSSVIYRIADSMAQRFR